MAKSAKPAPAEKAAPADAAAKPKSKKILLAIIGVLILVAGGGAGWYFMKGSKHAEEPKAVVAEPPTFLSLEPFTVNLQHEEGEQYLNIGITLKVSSGELADKIRQSMPEVRSRLLFLLSSKHATELVPIEGKKKLVREIIVETNNIIGLQSASQKIESHESAPTSNAQAASATGETPPVTAASAPVEAVQETHVGETGKGVVDVLFTAFIIQ